VGPTDRLSRLTFSVIIPTRGRPLLAKRAVESALAQTWGPEEVIVVIDGPDEETRSTLAEFTDARVKTVMLPKSRGAGGARNVGVESACGEYIAFLDDDDIWLPGKLGAQAEVLSSSEDPARTIVGCAAYWDDGTTTRVWPTRPPAPGERIAEYLFVRGHAGEGVLATPTLVVSRDLATRCPMPTHLKTHEEWDWILDLERAGAIFAVVMTPLVEVDARPRRASVSSSSNWRDSLAWPLGRATDMGDRAFSSFVLTEVARVAVLGKAPFRVHLAIAAIAMTGRPRLWDVARFLGRLVALARRAWSDR
jgi:glycosyltransferase involved in cell wall biosynthesis